eukprot:CAMPEP_0204577330 /NCGR_PEP_ID=MMETSP0661-20131031/42280_1 /ASSEMBLY_ACC=CAM_ASM_000606 /TAXON_ID=109239 /ORGANISM="Alexandrium margalefi, Strain AMGDE01CS-322" /LENGTH=421 /DNA_ID=CAMNT_0051586151 /DNA_START=54 /DNA_END=1319 /DNA_ORIENTATION=+
MDSLGNWPKQHTNREVLRAEVETGSSSNSSSSVRGGGVPVIKQLALMCLVVVTGCANNISKQIASKPLNRFSYMMGFSTAVAYVPLYGAVLLALLRAGKVPRSQLRFVWGRTSRGLPVVLFFLVMGLGDTLGDVIGMICTPYVSGPIHSLLANCTPIFMAFLSVLILSKGLSLMQCFALSGVCLSIGVGVLPSFQGLSKSSDPFYSTVLGLSCIFNAISWLVKELLFTRYRSWLVTEGIEDGGSGLNVFIVNTHAALIQLPLTLLCMPLNKALGQTHGQDLSQYMSEAFSCAFGGNADSCGSESSHGEVAGLCMAVYVVLNISWNISILWSVKHCGALATFVALKSIFPVSTVLFAIVDWPLLGQTQLNWLVWLSVILVIPFIGAYQYASKQQDQRARQHPSSATCCWPLLQSDLREVRSG